MPVAILRSPSISGAKRRQLSFGFDPAPYALLDLWPAKNANVLIGAGTPAGAFDYVATLQNRSTLAGKASNATQGTSASQPLYLPHEPGANYLYLPGIAGNYASVPDNASWNGMTDFAMEWEGFLLTSRPAANIAFLGSFSPTPNFIFYLTDGGLLSIYPDASTATVTAVTNQFVKYRVVRSGANTRFYEDIGAGWTQIGSAISHGGTFIGGTEVQIGCWGTNAWLLRGRTDRARIWSTATADSSAPILDVNFSAVPHRATSFVCATGQTVTINSTGTNPAFVVGDAGVLTDGVDDFLSGTFASALAGGRMFAVFDGIGGGDYGRIFTTRAAGVGDVDAGSFIWSIRNTGTDLASYSGGSFRAGIAEGYCPATLHEVYLNGGDLAARRNNGAEVTASGLTAANVTSYGIGDGSPLGSPAMFLRRLILLDASADIVAKTRAHLNTAHNLGLPLP